MEKEENVISPMVKTNMGEIPREDYLEIVAQQNGFSSYADMKDSGYTIY